MSPFVDLLGETLLGNGGEVKTADALANKVVAFYFSAHWCPPCKSFTPVLATAYKGPLSQKGFEVVFVSSDRSQEMFDEYYKEMPWLALPYSDRERKSALSTKFKVKGIPTLLIFDENGNVINRDGRAEVEADREGVKFPWLPPGIKECLGSDFEDNKGNKVTMEELNGHHIGIYFSAHWCPPCQTFTPKLKEVYEKLKDAGKKFTVIFASSDGEQKEFDGYFAVMPWLAIPFSERDRKEKLSRKFGISGIPALVILDPDMNIVSTNARGRVGGDPEGVEFPWGPRSLTNIDEDPSEANEFVSIYFIKGTMGADAANAIMDEMRALGEKYIASAESIDAREFIFYFSEDQSQAVASQIIGSIPAEDEARDDGAMLFLLDIPAGGKYYQHSDVSVAGVRALVSGHKDGSFTMSQLQ